MSRCSSHSLKMKFPPVTHHHPLIPEIAVNGTLKRKPRIDETYLESALSDPVSGHESDHSVRKLLRFVLVDSVARRLEDAHLELALHLPNRQRPAKKRVHSLWAFA